MQGMLIKHTLTTLMHTQILTGTLSHAQVSYSKI